MQMRERSVPCAVSKKPYNVSKKTYNSCSQRPIASPYEPRFEQFDMIGADDLVAVRLRVKGTHRGELMGVAPSGDQVDVEQITIFKLDNEGRCMERWVRLDELSFLQQIGAMPTPAAASA